MSDKSKTAKSAAGKPAPAKAAARSDAAHDEGADALTVKLSKPAGGNRAVVVRKTRAAAGEPATPILPAGERDRLVAETAYFIAEGRGFAPGGEQGDWFVAERRVDAAYRFA